MDNPQEEVILIDLIPKLIELNHFHWDCNEPPLSLSSSAHPPERAQGLDMGKGTLLKEAAQS